MMDAAADVSQRREEKKPESSEKRWYLILKGACGS